MARKLLQHVIEKADPSLDVECAGPVEIDRNLDLGLLRLALNCSRPGHVL
jgi:hypothetical protein